MFAPVIVIYLKFTQVEEELLEQEFLERCFQEMLDEEDQDWFIPARDLPPGMGQIQQQFNGLSVNDSNSNTEEIVVSFKTCKPSFASLYLLNLILVSWASWVPNIKHVAPARIA